MPAESEAINMSDGAGQGPAMGRSGVVSGLSWASVATSLILLLLLGLGMPHWTMLKSYPLGMGGYLPVEAFFLAAALLVFNRFRGGFALVAGLVVVALLAPPWHAAVNARTDDAIKSLPPLAHFLRLTCLGPIESAQASIGMPAVLTGLGALLVFALTVGLFMGGSVLLPALRRRFGWREIATIFVVLSVGTYCCKSVNWMVGMLHLPIRYDDSARDYKGRFLRPVPVDQEKIADPALEEALRVADANPSAVRTHPAFAASRVRRTLLNLERLRDNPADAEALSDLRDDGWGAEASDAAKLVGGGDKAALGALQTRLAELCREAEAKAAAYAREEALYEASRYNAAGVPSFLLPYDIHVHDRRTFEGAERYEADLAALKSYGRGFAKDALPPPKVAVPRFADYVFDVGRLSEAGFSAAQDSSLKRLSGTYLPVFETAGTSYKGCRVAEVGRDFLSIRHGLAGLDDGGGQAPVVQVKLTEVPAATLQGALTEAYRQATVLYMQEYRKYQKELAEKRAAAWTVFLSRWKGPLSWWLPLLALVLVLQFCLAALLRRQWCDHEKLMFPHAEAVRGLIEGDDAGSKTRRVLGNWTFWLGFAAAAVLMTFQGLSAYFPSAVPAPNLHEIKLDTFISGAPWSAMDRRLNIQPFMVGIAYLLTSEVSLSMWAFALVNQGLRVGANAWGLQRSDCWAIHGEIMNSDALYTGAMLVFVLSLVWGGRRHVWFILRRGLGLTGPDATEKSEPMSFPAAFWGFTLALAGILVWCALVGLKLWIMAFIIGFYVVLLILMCRVVSEAGAVTAATNWWPFFPHHVFCHVFGFGQGASFGKMIAFRDGWLGAGMSGAKGVTSTLRCYGVFQFIWPSMLYNLQLTPFVLAAFKLTETEPRRKRTLTALLAFGLLGAAALFVYGTLGTVFVAGADNVTAPAFNRMVGWAFNNSFMRDVVSAERMWSQDNFRVIMMGSGGAAMLALLVLRSSFYWWPLHPLGLAAFGLEFGLWVNFLLGWIFKRTALAFGGGEFSQRINPFFYGVIGGHLMAAAFWLLVGVCGSGVPSSMTILPAVGW